MFTQKFSLLKFHSGTTIPSLPRKWCMYLVQAYDRIADKL